jgi:hypothetical protein
MEATQKLIKNATPETREELRAMIDRGCLLAKAPGPHFGLIHNDSRRTLTQSINEVSNLYPQLCEVLTGALCQVLHFVHETDTSFIHF